MNIEQMLALPLAETFVVEGTAPNVLAAHNLAWDNFKASLGGDPELAWSLKIMKHAAHEGAVVFRAEFARDPNYSADE